MAMWSTLCLSILLLVPATSLQHVPPIAQEVQSLYVEAYSGDHFFSPVNDFKVQWQKNCSDSLEYIKQLGIPTISTDSNYNAVFIELGAIEWGEQMNAFEFLVRNAMTKLGSYWMHTLVAGRRGCEQMKALKGRLSSDVHVICYDAAFASVDEYNNVFKSAQFWRTFPPGSMLMYQADTILLRDGVVDFLEYDYVGAPWPRRQHDNKNCVGNGGLTIRSVSKMIEVIEKVKPEDVPLSENTKLYMEHASLSSVPEDIYFATAMLETGLGKVADYETARRFAEESVMGNDPFGAHQLWIDRPWKAPMDFQKVFNKVTYSTPCQRGHYYERVPHRGGWKRVVEFLMEARVVHNCTENGLQPEMPAFVDMMEFTPFKWNQDMAAQVLERPWVGVSHLTPDIGWKTMENWTFDYLVEGTDYFKDAFRNCKGVIFLSHRMQDYWTQRLDAGTWMSAFPSLRNTVAIMHPVDIHEDVLLFDLSRLNQVEKKKIVLLGQQLRRVHTIYQLDPGPSYEKVWSPGCSEEGFPRMLSFVNESAAFENVLLSQEQMDSVTMSYFEDAVDYDNMMATSYIIVDCYDASANNAILEAVRSNTPIFTRNLPAHVEYLGSGYPLYFDSVEALNNLFQDEAGLHGKVQAAHEYLKNMDKIELSLEYFGEAVRQFLSESFHGGVDEDLHQRKPECLECETVEGAKTMDDIK